MTPTQASLVPFTPTAVDPDQLERRTIGRSDVLDHLLEATRAATRGLDRAHTLLVAPRGGGKTHVLTLFVHRLRAEEKLAGTLAVVVVAEDAVEVGSYADLLVAVVEALGTSEETGSAHALRRDGARGELERLVLAILDGRPLVLVVENLDRVFAELGTEGQRQLRAFVETSRAVMLVASTPALFEGVSRRTEPWFGSFAVERLAPWSTDEGAAFLERVAQERGDDKLASLIASPLGRARLTAVDDLVGGLPRLWTILAGCITVELLDDLVPLVLKTLEELVPYYQARLNELPAGERKLVVALCRAETLGSEAGRTVRDLALAAGVPETSAPKLLRRLEEASWVLPTKPEGTDRRATWYETREPLLRYHVIYRRQAGEPLAIVVSFLRAWFSPAERRRHLGGMAAGSVGESYLMESLRDGPPTASDALYGAADPKDLLTGAREWFFAEPGTSTTVRSRTAAIVAEAAALVALGRTDEVEPALAARLGGVAAPGRDAVEQIAHAAVEAARARAPTARTATTLGAGQATVQAGLDAALLTAARGSVQDEVALGQVAHGWRGATGDHGGAYRSLTTLLERAGHLGEECVALRLAVEAELAFFGCQVGERPREVDRMRRVLADRERVLGPDHPDTLTSRGNLAWATGAAGDHGAARDLSADLAADSERVLGPDHPHTLASRHNHAWEAGAAGDHAAARDLLADVAADAERLLGADHPDTLTSRGNLAWEVGAAGDHGAARDLFADVAADRERVLGPDHPHTLSSRHNHAWEAGAAGDHAAARDLLADVAADAERLLGPDHPTTLTSRHSHAREAGDAGDHAAARDINALVTDAATTPEIALALVASTDDEPARVSNLTTAIVRAAGDRDWTRSDLIAWLDVWSAALAASPSAEVARAILDVIRREADGDATARPSLPPELRAIAPRVRIVPDDA